MIITNKDIERNLKNVEEGKPLDISLGMLNGEFKRKYFKCLYCGESITEGNFYGYHSRCWKKSGVGKIYMKKYRKIFKKETKEHNKRYYKTHKEWYKEYYQKKVKGKK